MKYKTNPKMVWEMVEEKAIILDPENGKYFNLNKTASQIWKMVNRCKDSKELVDILLKMYNVEIEVLTKDVEESLEWMRANNLIVDQK